MSDLTGGIPFKAKYLQIGSRYIKRGQTLFPCPGPVNILDLPPEDEFVVVLNKTMTGNLVLEHDLSCVTKSGYGVRPAEAEAMRLVAKNMGTSFVPEVIFTSFVPSMHNDSDYDGNIMMTLIQGSTLQTKWDTLDEKSKESVCLQIWNMLSKIRSIPRPSELAGLFQCAADGSPSRDSLLEDLQRPPRPLANDVSLRTRIYERYIHFGGLRHKDQLLNMLPRSDSTVFTHGDIAPRNIMVDGQNNITGILDWECAGWYPDYWEYAQIMRPAASWGDWATWMNRTAPQRWDLSGITTARKVLF